MAQKMYIEKSGEFKNIYFKMSEVYSEDYEEKYMSNLKQKVVYTNFDSYDKSKLQKYYEIFGKESIKKEYKYVKRPNYRNRVAYEFKILLPMKNKIVNADEKINGYTMKELFDVSKKLVKELIGEEKGLKATSFLETNKNITYVNIFILDREYHYVNTYATYSNTSYQNKNTLSFCNKNDPDAIIAYKKGDLKKDKNGNLIKVERYFKTTKTRRFILWEKNRSAVRNEFAKLIYQCLHFIEKFSINIIKAKYIFKKNIKYAFNRFAKRNIININRTISLIQNELNLLIDNDIKYSYDYKNPYHIPELIPNEFPKNYLDLYNKYKDIFKTNNFIFDDTEYNIKFTCRSDVLEKNLRLLLNVFYEDLHLKKLENAANKNILNFV